MAGPHEFFIQIYGTGFYKGLIKVAMAGPQEIFKQHLIKNEEQPSFLKRYSSHFGEISAMLLFA